LTSETSRYRSFRSQTAHYFFARSHDRIPDSVIEGAAAWRGSELREAGYTGRTRLGAEDIEEIEKALDGLESTGAALEDIDRNSAALPGLSPRIDQWRETLASGQGFVVVEGLPVEAWDEARSAMAFWLLGHHLGVPGAQNADNELLGHVTDYGEQAHSPNVRLYRTASEIGFHCDAADVVGLLCLRAAPVGGQSRIASSVAIFNALFEEDPDLAVTLFEPFAVDRRDEQPPGYAGSFEVPAARFDASGRLRTFYHSEYFRSVSRLLEIGPLAPERKRLLDRYDALAASPEFHLDMELAPGDMQFISNHTIVHARTVYEDAEEPDKKRHLLRLWLSLED
jgi:hypothetical protein